MVYIPKEHRENMENVAQILEKAKAEMKLSRQEVREIKSFVKFIAQNRKDAEQLKAKSAANMRRYRQEGRIKTSVR